MKYNLKVPLLLAFVAMSHLAACVSAERVPEKQSLAEPMLTGRVHVYDGDSIFFGKVEVRLDAIDAPERDQACRDKAGRFWPCGIVARNALRAMVGNAPVECRISGKDKYRRLLGICYVRSQDMNAAMVRRGYAISYHYFSEKYAPEETQARELRLGIWQDSRFTDPYYCRHFASGHICYEYDYALGEGRVAELPLIGKSHAVGAPD